MQQYKPFFGLILVIAVGVGLIYWSKTSSPSYKTAKEWNDTGVKCLPNGHQNLAQHIHPQISILVDGAPEIVPANIGNAGSCMSEIHTHDQTGLIHIESVVLKDFQLKHFFSIYGKTLARDGYTAKVTIDGASLTEEEALNTTLKDKQKIVVEYAKRQ